MKDGADGLLATKLAACGGILSRLGSVLVAFSAGVDSTLLLALAVRTLGPDKVLAAIGVSPSLPRRERHEAQRLAARIGATLVEIHTGELGDPSYAANSPDRCYFCKSDLFRRLLDLARARGLAAVISGANSDDRGDHRPGLRAGAELGVVNPLMDAGLTKQDVREASKAMGLPTWDKPSRACLASRIPYGQAVTVDGLARVERAEECLQDLGFAQCRVRDHQGVARIEVLAEDLPRVVQCRQQIVESLRLLGYHYVTVDLAGFRSGSMNELLSGGGPPAQSGPGPADSL
jgi:uncharacterized protein